MNVRRRVFFSGHVQGVGFRYTTASVARRHTVTGYVKNLSDGRVVLVAEGESSEVDRFVDDVARTMADYIHETTSESETATGEFRNFAIRH